MTKLSKSVQDMKKEMKAVQKEQTEGILKNKKYSGQLHQENTREGREIIRI